jgi:recombination protein RecT
MIETVSSAVEKAKTGAMSIVGQGGDWFGSILPSHVEPKQFVGMAKAYLRREPKLAEAADTDPGGFMICLSDCARLGLVPGDTFHILYFKNSRTGGLDWVGVTDYTGEIELIYRAGAVSSVKAEIVYSADRFMFSPDMDRPAHAPEWFSDRGEMIGVYAYAVMKDGATSRVVMMSRAEVMKVKAVSKAAGKPDSPWIRWEDRMWLKTAIHQLQKWVPTSAEYRREQLRAAVEADSMRRPEVSVAPDHTAEPVIDAEAAEDWPETAKPGES